MGLGRKNKKQVSPEDMGNLVRRLAVCGKFSKYPSCPEPQMDHRLLESLGKPHMAVDL